MTRRWGFMVVLVVACLMVLSAGGCSWWDDLPDEPAELAALVDRCVEDAKAAAEKEEGTPAGKASDLAQKAVEKLRGLQEEAGEGDAGLAELVGRAEVARTAAGRWAALAVQRERRRTILGSWKAKAYVKARPVAIDGVCSTLAFAAEQAARVDFEKLPEPVRRRAEAAVAAARLKVDEKGRLPQTPEEWRHVAETCRGAGLMMKQFSFVLVAPLLLTGRCELALVELETREWEPELVGLKDFLAIPVLLFNGMDLLAVEILDAKAGEDTESLGKGAGVLALANVALAAWYINEKRLLDADRALARAIRYDPNNFVVTYLTGEYQVASGNYVEAASSLEAAARGTEREFLCGQIAERARLLRDHPGSERPLFADPAFALQLARSAVAQADIPGKLGELLDLVLNRGYELGASLLESLPGFGGASSDRAATTTEGAGVEP